MNKTSISHLDMPSHHNPAAPWLGWRFAWMALVGLAVFCAGCTSSYAAKKADKSGLEVDGVSLRVKMMNNMFLPPLPQNVPREKRLIFLKGTNTSTSPEVDDRMLPQIQSTLIRRGYILVNDPEKANYILLFNVLYIGKEVQDLSTLTTISSGVAGAAVAATVGKENEIVRNAGIGALAGTITGTVTGHYFETSTYQVVVDLQIQERRPPAPPALTSNDLIRKEIEQSIRLVNAHLKYVEPDTEMSSLTLMNVEADRWQTYNNQVVGYASDVRLKYEKAEPTLLKAISKEISGLFWELSPVPGK